MVWLTAAPASALAAVPVLPPITGLSLQLEVDLGLTLGSGNNARVGADQSGKGNDAIGISGY